MVRWQINGISVTWEDGVTTEGLLIERTTEKMSHRKEMISGKRSWEPLQMKEGSPFPSSKKTNSTCFCA